MCHVVLQVDTLHMVCVLCMDDQLSKENFQHMMRCTCKGHWSHKVCSHILVVAHWHGEDCLLLGVVKLNDTMPENARPGRKWAATKALQTQPESPKRARKAPNVGVAPTGDLRKAPQRRPCKAASRH